jgi:rhamnosyltransferase
MGVLASIIIRTKNEGRWISSCLQNVFEQTLKDFEVIVVDNESTDETIDRVRQFPVHKVLTCKQYRPGKALNLGIREARGKFIVCLSGHCIPVTKNWLEDLLKNFSDPTVAGVYGRQEPLSFSSDLDKRDLVIVFGLDRKIQFKDSFFHNANSAIRKHLWDEVPFDEHTTNIEDRIWAQQILKKNFKLIYEPDASVYHYHGIHQSADEQRCANVVRIIENLNQEKFKPLDAQKLNTIALIPIRGPIQTINGEPLMFHSIQRALASKYVRRTIVLTDNKECAQYAKKMGAEVPFLREDRFSKSHVDLLSVLRYSLEELEKLKIFPDLIVSLEITFPFRPKELIDKMILQLNHKGFDSIVAAKRENKAIWKAQQNKISQVTEGLTPRKFKDPTYIELRGLGYVGHPDNIRTSNLYGKKAGIFEVDNAYANLEVRNSEEFEIAAPLLKNFF